MNEKDMIAMNKKIIQNEIIHSLLSYKDIKKSELAEVLGVSRSFVSQLFSGDKYFNLDQLAKLQMKLKLKITLDMQCAESLRIKHDPKRFKIHTSQGVAVEPLEGQYQTAVAEASFQESAINFSA